MTAAKGRRRLPDHIAAAMTAILDYLWQGEAQDYVSRGSEDQEGHIFNEMLTVRQWLAQSSRLRKRPPSGN